MCEKDQKKKRTSGGFRKKPLSVSRFRKGRMKSAKVSHVLTCRDCFLCRGKIYLQLRAGGAGVFAGPLQQQAVFRSRARAGILWF